MSKDLSANVRLMVLYLWLLLAWEFQLPLIYGACDPINTTHSI